MNTPLCYMLTSAELIIETIVKELKLRIAGRLIHGSNENPVSIEGGYITVTKQQCIICTYTYIIGLHVEVVSSAPKQATTFN